MSRPRVLYISYNSLIEPLGRSQVVPYVQTLSRTFDMMVLSFEKAVRGPRLDAEERTRLAATLKSQGIAWIIRYYHKRPSVPATLFDILQGFWCARRAHAREAFALIHARGYVPAAIAWGLKRWAGIPYLFDIRGLQAEEYVDAGHWTPRQFRFHLVKRVEQWMVHDADGIVTLTEAAQPLVRDLPGMRSRTALPPWEIIPSCVDLEHYQFTEVGRRRIRASLGVGTRPILVYAGSTGTWYLLKEMLEFFSVLRAQRPEWFFLLLTNGSQESARAALQRAGMVEGRDAAIRCVSHDDMPAALSAADAGIAFIQPSLSKRSSSPTKYAEYLACGLPLIANAGVGDVDRLLEDGQGGVLVRGFDRSAFARAVDELEQQVQRGRATFRAVAERDFSLARRAYPAYAGLYQRILSRGTTPHDLSEQESPETVEVAIASSSLPQP